MSPNTPGDGTAPAATYTITGFTLYETAFPSDVLTGSIADGTYKFGTQPLYQIIWSGTSPTTWKRDNGTYTNGLGMYSNVIPAKADLVFETNFQEGYIDTVSIFSSSITPTLSPAPASGLCPGQVAPTPSPSPSTTPSQQSQPLAETGIATAPFFAGFAALVLGIGAMLFARKRSQ